MRRKVAAALVAGLVFYALSDIMLWQRIFEAHDMFQFDAQYQSGHVTTMVALIATGMILLWDTKLWSVWYGLASYTLTFSGLEDILYYWLDGKAIPTSLPWLDYGSPLVLFRPVTAGGLVASAMVWIAFWTASLWLIPRLGELTRRVSRGPLSFPSGLLLTAGRRALRPGPSAQR